MLISEISNFTSWAGDIRNMVMRETFKYDKGSDVTVVTVRSQRFEQSYDKEGKETPQDIKGSNVDVRS